MRGVAETKSWNYRTGVIYMVSKSIKLFFIDCFQLCRKNHKEVRL